jgi:hypothetical protein
MWQQKAGAGFELHRLRDAVNSQPRLPVDHELAGAELVQKADMRAAAAFLEDLIKRFRTAPHRAPR